VAQLAKLHTSTILADTDYRLVKRIEAGAECPIIGIVAKYCACEKRFV